MSHTGLTPKKFGELSIEFRVEWKRITSHFTIEDKPRQRIILPRKTNVLPEVQYKLQLILIHLNTYPMWGFQAITFDDAIANLFWIHGLSTILQETLKRLGELFGKQ